MLLDKGYEVFGVVRRSSHLGIADHRLRWLGIADRVHLVDGNMIDLSSLLRIVEQMQPDEIYNLAAQSFVATSWDQPIVTAQVSGLGVVNMLEALRVAAPKARFYQASSSEMFGSSRRRRRARRRRSIPRSPYAVGQALRPLGDGELPRELRPARLVGHPLQPREPAARRRVRDPQGHRRGGAHQDRRRQASCGSATSTPSATGATRKDYVRAMWLMLQQDEPDDYVIATGVATTVRDMCKIAFDYVGLNMDDHVKIDPACTARPRSTCCSAIPPRPRPSSAGRRDTLEEVIREMVDADLDRMRQRVSDCD